MSVKANDLPTDGFKSMGIVKGAALEPAAQKKAARVRNRSRGAKLNESLAEKAGSPIRLGDKRFERGFDSAPGRNVVSTAKEIHQPRKTDAGPSGPKPTSKTMEKSPNFELRMDSI